MRQTPAGCHKVITVEDIQNKMRALEKAAAADSILVLSVTRHVAQVPLSGGSSILTKDSDHLRRATGMGEDGGGGEGGGQEGDVVGIEGIFVACGVIVHDIPLPPIQKVAAAGDPCATAAAAAAGGSKGNQGNQGNQGDKGD
jgi:hypothetical protein